ncbi:MAG: hypothetical protein WC761_02100 [Candidatus Paceibacterota bacterium]|jgi:hypothetical protein
MSILFQPGQLFVVSDEGITNWEKWFLVSPTGEISRPLRGYANLPRKNDALMYLGFEERARILGANTALLYKFLFEERLYFAWTASSRWKPQRLTSIYREALYTAGDEFILFHLDPI